MIENMRHNRGVNNEIRLPLAVEQNDLGCLAPSQSEKQTHSRIGIDSEFTTPMTPIVIE